MLFGFLRNVFFWSIVFIHIMKVKGYSLLEIILVTSFIIIFIVVINPGTYIDRFSKMLLKINVLNESELLVAKLNSFAYDDCDIQGVSSVGIDFYTVKMYCHCGLIQIN